MGKTIRVKVTAQPVTDRGVRVKTLVSSDGTTRAKIQTIRMK